MLPFILSRLLSLFLMLGSVRPVHSSEGYIRKVKGIGVFQCFNEAFMESFPQMVLQLSIVLHRGYACEYATQKHYH